MLRSAVGEKTLVDGRWSSILRLNYYLRSMTSSNSNNDFVTSQEKLLSEKLEWITPKISLMMEAKDTTGNGKGYAPWEELIGDKGNTGDGLDGPGAS